MHDDKATLYPTYIVIPFKDEPEMTLHVVSLCLQARTVTDILLYDNGSTSETVNTLVDGLDELQGTTPGGYDKNIHYFQTSDLGIYQMWNAGWQFAIQDQNNGNSNIAFLNNDIDFWPETLNEMAKILRRESGVWTVYPNYNRAKSDRIQDGAGLRYTEGTYSRGGMCGWMFMTRTEMIIQAFPGFDEDFEWWCGDDAFANEVQRRGGQQARLMGHPCDHINEATASNGSNNWTHEAKSRDLVRLSQKWG